MKTRMPRAGYMGGVADWGPILLIDLDQAVTITNDAEAVVLRELEKHGPGKRILYRDTDGIWSELKHDGARFTGFADLNQAEIRARKLT